jgi:hypothetical protein
VKDHGSPGKRDALRLWVDGVEPTTTGQLTAGDVVISHVALTISGSSRPE